MVVVLVAGGVGIAAAAAATLTFTLPPHQPSDLINQQHMVTSACDHPSAHFSTLTQLLITPSLERGPVFQHIH